MTSVSSLPAPGPGERDQAFMQRALELAHEAIGVSDPNPRVGCVLVDVQGRTIAEGHTQAAGYAHAEAVALANAAAQGRPLAGATAYVTLEPCAHHGRTPPCADALVAAGIARAVVSVVDPNPLVAGQGIERMRAAGIEVSVGLLADESHELNIGFFSRMVRGLPWVRMKAAASLDGCTALENGASQWITGPAARADGHAWRKRAGAILTGVGTVMDDDPRLDVRLVPTERQPLRVIVDSRLQISPQARILEPPGQTLVFAAIDDPERRTALEHRGAEVVVLPNAAGKVDLAAALQELARRGVNEVHVEAGSKLNGSFVREQLVDEWLVYLAPKMLGIGRPIAAFGPLAELSAGLALQFHDIQRIGDDVRVLARRADVGTPAP